MMPIRGRGVATKHPRGLDAMPASQMARGNLPSRNQVFLSAPSRCLPPYPGQPRRGRAGSPRGRVTPSPIDPLPCPVRGAYPGEPRGALWRFLCDGFSAPVSRKAPREFARERFIFPGDFPERGMVGFLRMYIRQAPQGRRRQQWGALIPQRSEDSKAAAKRSAAGRRGGGWVCHPPLQGHGTGL